MIRIAAVCVATIAVAACGTGHHAGSGTTRPPAATVTTVAGTHRLTTASSCWTAPAAGGTVGGCGDTGPPATIPGLATIRVRVGETIVVHLDFTPTGRVDAALAGHRLRLPSASTLRLHVTRTGLLRIDASRGRDQVEYLARLITGPLPAGAA